MLPWGGAFAKFCEVLLLAPQAVKLLCEAEVYDQQTERPLLRASQGKMV